MYIDNRFSLIKIIAKDRSCYLVCIKTHFKVIVDKEFFIIAKPVDQ